MHPFTFKDHPYRYDAERDKVQEQDKTGEWVDVRDADLREALFRELNDGYPYEGD